MIYTFVFAQVIYETLELSFGGKVVPIGSTSIFSVILCKPSISTLRIFIKINTQVLLLPIIVPINILIHNCNTYFKTIDQNNIQLNIKTLI